MDELLQDFIVETNEHLEHAESRILAFECSPGDTQLVTSLFRLMHTIKGTAGFLSLEQLQAQAHATESLIVRLRDGEAPTPLIVSEILAGIDKIKLILRTLKTEGGEPQQQDLIAPCGPPPATAVPVSASVAPLESAVPPSPPAGSPPVQPQAEKRKGSTGASRAPDSIRVAVPTIERMMQLVSELVLSRNELLELARQLGNGALENPLQRLSALTSDLQDSVMQARMQPMERLFASLPRLVRELSGELGKKIELVAEGADTELDRQLIDIIRDPLTHMIRNCVDHGIEHPADRLAAGKPEQGRIVVRASHEAGQITVEIADDGRGLDRERIRSKALARGLADQQRLASISDGELFRFIFEPGFSTAQSVTSVSGRGVGMDVVRSNIESIGGLIDIQSESGRGTRFLLRIPLTLAITPALIVESAGQCFAVPQHSVVEIVAIGEGSRHRIEQLQKSIVLRLREQVVPVVDLRSVLGLPEAGAETAAGQLVVVARIAGSTFGVIVDKVADVQEIVVKPMGASLAHIKAYSGHTMLGSGAVALIINPSHVSSMLGAQKSSSRDRDLDLAGGAGSATTSLLVFRAGGGVDKVLPLSSISRIEMIPHDRLTKTSSGYVTHLQGRLLPVAAACGSMPEGCGASPILVIASPSGPYGLLVERIIDIVDETLEIQISSDSGDSCGAVEIKGQVAELLDLGRLDRAQHANLPRASKSHGQRVLLLEPDARSRDLLVPVIRACGYAVAAVDTPVAALAMLQSSDRFDAVIAAADVNSIEMMEFWSKVARQAAAPPFVGLVDTDATPCFGQLVAASVVDRSNRSAVIAALLATLRQAAEPAAAATSTQPEGLAA